MRTIQVCVVAAIAAVLGSLATLAAQKQIQKSTVFEWAALEASEQTSSTTWPPHVSAAGRSACVTTTNVQITFW